MKRVLIITYYWPPSGGSGVQRWLKFAKYLPQFGWEPVIYTPLNPEVNSTDDNLLRDVSPRTEVIKRKIIEPYSIYKMLSGKGRNEKIKANIIASSEGHKSSLMQRISMFIRGNIFIPDPRCLWIGPSVRFLKSYLKEHPADAIVSTGPPHSMHLIAQKVSRATSIPWIADFRDPWTEIFYFKHLNLSKYALKRHKRLEAGVVGEADRVIVVSRKMQQDFEQMAGQLRKNGIDVITNGFDPDDFRSDDVCRDDSRSDDVCQENFCRERGKFSLVHTGLLVENGNPDLLWQVLAEIATENPEFKRELEIVVMGQTDQPVVDDINRAGLSDNFRNLGYVAHNVAVEWQKRASLLLLPLRKEPEAAAILTGKFFEYLASGARILAFGPEEGDLGKALRECGGGTICEWDDRNKIKGEILSCYRLYREGKLENKVSEGALKYSRKELTSQLAAILEEITAEK